MFLTKYLKLIWSGLLFLGGVVITFMTTTALKNRKEKKRIVRQYERAKEVMRQDVEIDQEHDSRNEELANDVEKRKRFVANPNDGWVRDKDD